MKVWQLVSQLDALKLPDAEVHVLFNEEITMNVELVQPSAFEPKAVVWIETSRR